MRKDEKEESQQEEESFTFSYGPAQMRKAFVSNFDWEISAGEIMEHVRLRNKADRPVPPFLGSSVREFDNSFGIPSAWSMVLDPQHIVNGVHYVSLYLRLNNLELPLEEVDAAYELQFITPDGKVQKSKKADIRRFDLHTQNGHGFDKFMQYRKILEMNPLTIVTFKVILMFCLEPEPVPNDDEGMQISQSEQFEVKDVRESPFETELSVPCEPKELHALLEKENNFVERADAVAELNLDAFGKAEADLNLDPFESAETDLEQMAVERTDSVAELNLDAFGKAELNVDAFESAEAELEQMAVERTDSVAELNLDAFGKAELNVDAFESAEAELNLDAFESAETELEQKAVERADALAELNLDAFESAEIDLNQEVVESAETDLKQNAFERAEIDLNQEVVESAETDLKQNTFERADAAGDLNLDTFGTAETDINLDAFGTAEIDIKLDTFETAETDINLDAFGTAEIDIKLDAFGTAETDLKQKAVERAEIDLNQEVIKSAAADLNLDAFGTAETDLKQMSVERAEAAADLNLEAFESAITDLNRKAIKGAEIYLNQEVVESVLVGLNIDAFGSAETDCNVLQTGHPEQSEVEVLPQRQFSRTTTPRDPADLEALVENEVEHNFEKVASSIFDSDEESYQGEGDLDQEAIDNAIRDLVASLYVTKNKANSIVSVSGIEIPVHSYILKARSAVFREHYINNGDAAPLSVSDTDPEIMEGLLKYSYTNGTELLSDYKKTTLLLDAADKFKFAHLQKKCTETLLALSDEDTFYTTYNILYQREFNSTGLKYTMNMFIRDMTDLREKHPGILSTLDFNKLSNRPDMMIFDIE